MQNLEMHFSYWAQYIDSIETCQYPTVNSQISFFYDTAVDFCDLNMTKCHCF